MTNSCGVSADDAAGQTIQSLKLKVGDDRIHYLKAGSGSPVLFLHGGACDSRDWIGTMTALSDHCTSYALDLVGYGLSDNNKDGYSLPDLVEPTVGFVEALDLRRLVLVGHSLGGRVCLEIAMRIPERVQKLIVVDMAGFSRLARLGRFVATLAWAFRKIRRLPQPYPRLLSVDRGQSDWICLDKLPTVAIPTLIVWSRWDPYYPLSGALRAAELMPEAHLEVLPCFGHAPHRKKSGTFVNLVLDSVRKEQVQTISDRRPSVD
jgi:pimeloyl-ACP methyl ester carboxylesterase